MLGVATLPLGDFFNFQKNKSLQVLLMIQTKRRKMKQRALHVWLEIRSLGLEDPPGAGNGNSTPVFSLENLQWTEEAGGLQFGVQRVAHN